MDSNQKTTKLKTSTLLSTLLVLSISPNSYSDLTESLKLSATPGIDDAPNRYTNDGTYAEIDIQDIQGTVNINWDSFDIGKGETVEFIQYNSDSVAINNISDVSGTNIAGTITANGHIFLVNNDGFTFTQGATINTNGFLASTFDIGNDGTFLTTEGQESIKIEELSATDKSQYIAIFSPDIILGETGKDFNLASKNTILSSTSMGTIYLPGLPGFPINTSAAAAQTDIGGEVLSGEISILAENIVNNTLEDKSLVLSQRNISTLMDSVVATPEMFNFESLELHSDSEITLDSGIENFNEAGFTNLTFQTNCTSDCDININRNILGSGLNLSLFANGDGSDGSSHSNITIETDPASNYSRLGGNSGLNSLNIVANNFYLDNDLIAINLDIDGNLLLPLSDDIDPLFQIQIDESMTVTGEISFTGISGDNRTDLIISAETLSLFGLKDTCIDQCGSGNEVLSGVDDITIYTSNLNMSGTYQFDDTLTINGQSSNDINITLYGDTTFEGNKFNLKSATLSQDTVNSNYNLNFGSTASRFNSIALENLETTNTTLGAINIYLSENIIGDATESATLTLGGNISTNNFTIDSAQNAKIELTSDLFLNNLTTLDFGNSDITSRLYGINATGNNNQNSTASFGGIDIKNLNVNQFNSAYFTLDQVSADNSISIDSSNIIVAKNDTNGFTFSTNTGDLLLKGSINVDSIGNQTETRDISITTSSGSLSLNGVKNAKNLNIAKLNNFTSSNHNMTGEYSATEKISINGLGNIKANNSDISFSANEVDLTGSDFTSVSNFSLTANKSTIDGVSAQNIYISGSSDVNTITGNTNLLGNLIATQDLDFYLETITLQNDITLEGNLNLLDAKSLIAGEILYGTEANPGVKVADISGNQNLTINASNTEAYLYDLGKNTPLASLTLNNEKYASPANLHFIEGHRPIISGTRGLSILGDWYWTEAGAINYSTTNYNLNLSGVTINALGTATFNTGTADLSIGSIGSFATTSDLIIESAGTLSLHGDINLTKPENGYQFGNVNAIELHTDLVFGDETTPLVVNFGDATIDGTHSLTLYSDDITLGTIGSNVALQNLSIFSTADITISNDINLVGTAEINANSFTLDSNLYSSGKDVNISTLNNITLNKASSIVTDNGSIFLNSELGNIGLSTLSANTLIDVKSDVGFIYNGMDDYISNTNTSINLTASELSLHGKTNVGQSVDNPIVLFIENNGSLTASSDGNIYIANLSSSPVISSGKVLDSASVSDLSLIDSYSQLKLSSLNIPVDPTYETTLGLIEHINWQAFEDEESVRKIMTPTAAPNLYRSRNGWRLGY